MKTAVDSSGQHSKEEACLQNVSMSVHPILAVLFDLDGTLVHSSLNFAQIRRDVGCPAGQDVLEYVASLPYEAQADAKRIIRQHELEDARSARLIAGAGELLDRLADAGIRTGIITRNSVEATQIKLASCDIQVTHVLTREDAAPKPDPEALLHLSSLWQLQTDVCVYVGDYLYDLQAAKNAGMHACLFHPSLNGEPALPEFAALADFICHDYAEFEVVLTRYLNP
jgi:HAD superfamily hydrolase (TIGR01509 family)